MKTVQLTKAGADDKDAMFDMMQRYIAEFSAFEPMERGSDGMYHYFCFDDYWKDREKTPYFITADGQRAGLVFVNRNHYVTLWKPSRSIAEFYVEPEFRREKVGTAAARLLVESYGGWWQLMMHPKNYPSHTFWRRTFDYDGVVEVKLHRGPKWYGGGLRGEVMTFKVRKK